MQINSVMFTETVSVTLTVMIIRYPFMFEYYITLVVIKTFGTILVTIFIIFSTCVFRPGLYCNNNNVITIILNSVKIIIAISSIVKHDVTQCFPVINVVCLQKHVSCSVIRHHIFNPQMSGNSL